MKLTEITLQQEQEYIRQLVLLKKVGKAAQTVFGDSLRGVTLANYNVKLKRQGKWPLEETSTSILSGLEKMKIEMTMQIENKKLELIALEKQLLRIEKHIELENNEL